MIKVYDIGNDVKLDNTGEYKMDISNAIQNEVTRIRNMISETKTLFPDANINFAIYEMTLASADKAVREQDAVALIKILPELKEMH